jgi:uncharacterized protein (TIGR02266 family)
VANDEPREHPRVEATFRVLYTTIDQLLVAYSFDLSKGGMFLQTDDLLPINAVIQVNLELAEGSSEIPVICRVAYVRDAAEAAEGRPAGMGIEFLDMNNECLALIQEFIASKIHGEEPAIPMPPDVLNVLVVDDDEAVRTLAGSAFAARSDRVRYAADGFEAFAMCLKDPPDILISDVHMPRMDGWQLLRLVRARPSLSSVPVLFLTTLSGNDERLRGYQLGVDDYIAKPFSPRELAARVDRIMTRVQRWSTPNLARKTLRGDIDHVSLGSVLSFLELERKTGELLVVGDEEAARLSLRDGRLVRASIDGSELRSRQAIRRVLRWKSGVFELAQQDVAGPDEVGMSIAGLLLSLAKETDEEARDKENQGNRFGDE